jgi:hypothetical protein
MKKLLSIGEVADMITRGERLILAGDEKLLKTLPKGKWIGGTIPYFMGDDGGVFTKEKVYVDALSSDVKNVSVKEYSCETLPNITVDEFDNGYSVIIIPGFSAVHTSFAEKSYTYKDVFNRPLLGWISGIDLGDLGKITPKVFNGTTGTSSDANAVVMHIELPTNKAASLDIVNLFSPGQGDTITFPADGFSATECLVNGAPKNFAEYLLEKNIDTKLPLVADYCGAMINTSFQLLDEKQKKVNFYAPVFRGIEYKVAAPIKDYVKEFTQNIESLKTSPTFSCNCILNYLYSGLEGKKTGSITGPMTFGEIAYQLLNQTMVYLVINDV